MADIIPNVARIPKNVNLFTTTLLDLMADIDKGTINRCNHISLSRKNASPDAIIILKNKRPRCGIAFSDIEPS